MKRILLLSITLLALTGMSPLLQAESISFRADTMTGNAGENRRSTTLSGHAWIKTSDMEIQANVIELTGTDYDTVTATGMVSGSSTSSGFTFTCNTLTYHKNTGIVTLQGDVIMTDDENGVYAEARYIEYNQKTETALMQIGVRLTQKESLCTCAMAVYRKNDQLLEMSGSPQVVRGTDTFKAQEISFNLKTEEIVLDGRVRGTVQDQQKGGEAS